MASRRMAAFVSAGLVVASCGGSPIEPSPAGSGDAPPTTAGRSRLAWDQAAASSQALATFQFTLYLDGQRATLEDVRCPGATTPAGFSCSGLLPVLTAGRHVLEVTATVAGIESPRSPALTITAAA